MLEKVTPMDIVIEINMIRTSHRGAIVIVEGTTDERLFSCFIDKDMCQLIPVRGKDNVINIINITDSIELDGILGVVDSDYWKIEEIDPPSKNIVTTDLHDIELMLFCSPALERVTKEIGSHAKIASYLSDNKKDSLQEIILCKAKPIGMLRYISHRDELNLRFEGVKHASFVNKDTLNIDSTKLVKNVVSGTNSPKITIEETKELLERSIDENELELNQLNCGHDITAILAIGFRKVLGSVKAILSQQEYIEKALRLSYEFRDFAKTELHESIVDWEKNNAPFRVLVNN